MDILTYVNVKLLLSPGRAGGLPVLIIELKSVDCTLFHVKVMTLRLVMTRSNRFIM